MIQKKGLIYIVLAGIFWGTAGLFVSALGEAGFDSIQTASGRCFTAAVVLWLFVIVKFRSQVRISMRQMIIVAAEGMSFYAMAVLYFAAMRLTSVSTASVLLSTAPVLVMLVSVLFWGERLTPVKTGAILLSLIGCCLVNGVFTDFAYDLTGISVGILGALMYAIYSICTKLAMQTGMEAEINMAYSFLFAALVSVAVCSPGKWMGQIEVSGVRALLLIIGVGVVTGALAGLMYTKGMRLLPAGVASALAVVEPLTTTILSVTVLGEKLTGTAVAGIGFILTAVCLLSAGNGSREERSLYE